MGDFNFPVKKAVAKRAAPQTKLIEGEHLGRWKLVYADFVTVMMTFFLVVWILLYKETSPEKQYDRKCTNEIANFVRAKVASDPSVIKGKEPIQVTSDYSVEGVRFTLVDTAAAMFQSGRSEISEFAKKHFDTIAEATKRCSLEHKLKIEGYTDATKFGGADTGFGNWELSAARANAARRELLLRGLEERSISEVVGYGDSRPALPEDPNNAVNRRVSITVIAPLIPVNTTSTQEAPQG